MRYQYQTQVALIRELCCLEVGDLVTTVMGEIGIIVGKGPHADYMKDGVIFNLIASVVESSFVLDKVKCVLYYAINGKNAWKRRIGFRPVSIEIQGT